LAHALSVFENSMASIKSPAGADSSNGDRPARSRGLADQTGPVDNTVIDDSRPVDAASVRSSEHSENGMRVDSNVGGHASVPVVYPTTRQVS